MKIKFLLLTLALFVIGCGSYQEPVKEKPSKNIPSSITSTSLKTLMFSLKEDEVFYLDKGSFAVALSSVKSFDGIKIFSLPKHGILFLDTKKLKTGDRIAFSKISNIKYVPDENYHGRDLFMYKAYAYKRFSKLSTVVFSINSVNDTPVFTIQTYKKSFEAKTIAKDLNKSSSIVSVDLNHDGKIDILSTSEETGRVIWLENIDGKNFSEHNITTTLSSAKDIKAVDIDKDGDLDLVIGGSKLSLYLNHDLNFTEKVIDTNSSLAVDIADIDSDGDLDIASVEYDNNIVAIYKNTNQTFSKTTIDDTIKNPTGIAIFDKDKDGKKDIVVSAYYDGLVWYQQKSSSFNKKVIYNYSDNSGTDYLTIYKDGIYSTNYDSESVLESNTTLFTHYQPTAIKLGDLDNDGDDDIVLSSYSYSYMVWYENINSTYKPHYIETYSHAEDVTLDDINSDGFLDIVVAHHDESKITLFLSSDTVFVDENNKTVIQIKATDVDGDTLTFQVLGEDKDSFKIDSNGNLEFIDTPDYEDPKDSDKNNMYNITITVSDNETSISKNLRVVVKNLSFFHSQTISTGYKSIRDIEFKGYDIVVADDDGLFVVDENFTKNSITTSYDYPRGLAVVDDTLIVGFGTRYIALYDSLGNERELDNNCSNDCPNNFRLLKTDLDDDNKSDIVATCDDRIKWFKQENNGSYTKTTLDDTFINYTYDIVRVGDDLLVSVPDDNTIYKLKNDGNQNFTKEDYDADIVTVSNLAKKQDSIFALSVTDNLIYHYQNGVKTAINDSEHIAYPNSIVIADIDGDSKDDVVITTKDDRKVLWYKQLQDGTFKEHLIMIAPKEPVKTLVKDVNSDGYKDIVLATGDSIMILYGSVEEKE